ncbi:methyltransferase [Calothrix sp. HK-06]|nr:methyltransferase [Calothrix sp. HK-06]
MSNLISETILPNGLKIFVISKEEALVLYEQVNEYFKNEIVLHPGDTVFDVGANIGLFSLSVYESCNKNVNIFAFEPIPAIFNVLQANAQRFNLEKIKVFPCGISDESKITQFDYYPNATALSNAFPEDAKQLQNQLKSAIINNIYEAPPRIRRLRWLPKFMRSIILHQEGKKAFQVERVTCKMRTLSDILQEYNIQKVDLLKIDVEKSELDVFLGIKEQDWQKIKQVVVEVHDVDGRVDQMAKILKNNGFSKVILEQEPVFKGSNIFSLYALRQKSE